MYFFPTIYGGGTRNTHTMEEEKCGVCRQVLSAQEHQWLAMPCDDHFAHLECLRSAGVDSECALCNEPPPPAAPAQPSILSKLHAWWRQDSPKLTSYEADQPLVALPANVTRPMALLYHQQSPVWAKLTTGERMPLKELVARYPQELTLPIIVCQEAISLDDLMERAGYSFEEIMDAFPTHLQDMANLRGMGLTDAHLEASPEMARIVAERCRGYRPPSTTTTTTTKPIIVDGSGGGGGKKVVPFRMPLLVRK